MRGPWKYLGAAAALLSVVLFDTAAVAQGAVQQSGPIVPFHNSSWFGNGVIGDGGTPAKPYTSALGLFNGSTCPFGVSSQPGPGVALTPYSTFSVCQSNTATTLSFQGLNGQPTPSIFFNVGGAIYPFPGPGLGSVTSVGLSGGTTGLTSTGGPVTGIGTFVLGGVLNVANGGTGQSTAAAAINALLPAQGGNSGKVLGTNGAIAAWTNPTGGTVTSITAGTGLTGGTITGAGTVALDTTRVFTSGASGLVPASGGGTANFLRADGAFAVPVPGGVPTLAGTNIFTGYNNFSPGTSTSGAVPLSLSPSDYGVGHPAMSFQKETTANTYTIGLFDGASNAGHIRLSAGSTDVVGGLTVTGGSTVGGSAVCTMATGCGGGGGGGYATVYDVVANYGGHPTGGGDNTAAYNAALSACSGGGGGIIWFQAGTFVFNSAIADNVAGCSIKGAGQVATWFVPTGAIGNFLTINFGSSVNPTEFSNFGIQPGSGWTSGYAIAGTPTSTHFHDIYMLSPPQALLISGGAAPLIDSLMVWPATSSPVIGCDDSLGAVFEATMRDSNVNGSSSSTVIEQGANCNSLILDNVVISGGGGGICFHAATNAGTFDSFVNVACDHTQQGVIFDGGSGVQITSSWFGSTISGNGLTFSSSFSGFASVSNSHIRDNSNGGVLINGSGGVALVGNIISGNAAGNVLVGSNVNYFQINSNMIGVPGDPTANSCVSVNTGSSNYYTIANNMCGPTNSAGVVDNGSGAKKSVTGNVGP